MFVGIRPLVKSGDGKLTAALSRDHTIHIDASGLLTTTGGKWTTYRNMAEHTVDQAADLARLPERPCVTRTLNVHGFHTERRSVRRAAHLRLRRARDPGSDARRRRRSARRCIPTCRTPARRWSGPPATRWRARVEDVLARRTRALFLNARAAIAMAPEVARLMAAELGWDATRTSAEVATFTALARGYQV